MTATTDRRPLKLDELLLSPTLTDDEVLASFGMPARLVGEPGPGNYAAAVAVLPCPGRPGGVRVVVGVGEGR